MSNFIFLYSIFYFTMIDFTNTTTIEEAGFSGFITIESLMRDSAPIPKQKGVYLVLRLDTNACDFLDIGTGGHFKGKNPNVLLSDLQSNWVNDACVVYIGKAGAENSKATLHSRLGQYLKFGQGRNIGHWGGRLIWQLKDSPQLVVCWKALPNDDPRTVEKELIKDFVRQYGKRPFANLAD